MTTIAEVNKVTGEGSNVSNSKRMGVFIDLDTFANEILGMSGKSKPGVDPQHLSKIWQIDEEAAQQTIEVTSQLLKQEATNIMPKNFSTNNRMLRYKCIHSYFFTNTFFVPKQHKS